MRSLPRLLLLLAFALLAWLPASAITSVQIHDIMANLPNSPYLGQSVSVSGIIVGVLNTGGFYISEPSGSWDNLVSTAEGMPVFYAAGQNPACAVVGNVVTVTGTVTNTTAVTAANTPGTGVTPTSCTVTGTGTMTQSISLSSVLTAFGDALKYTGMAASNSSFYAVSPTSGTLAESTESVTSTGQFWATLSNNTATNNHLFRAAGIAGDEFIPSTAPSTVATYPGNPQRILIDTATFGGTPIDITVGQSISCAVPANISLGATTGIGLIDYTLGYARLLIFKTSICTVTGTVAPTASAPADSTHFQVGTLDLNRFYSYTGATPGSVPITPAAYTLRLEKAATAITNSLGLPDILAVQEVQDLPTLNDIASVINSVVGTNYQAYLALSNDPNSLNLGYLVKASTITVTTGGQVGTSDTYTSSTGPAILWERPPLVLLTQVKRAGVNYPVTLIDVDLTSRDNIGDPVLGPDIRARRAAQAANLSALVQQYQTAGQNVLIAGNFNAFQFNDGYVDVLGIVTGSPAPASAVTLYQATNTTAALTNFTNSVPANTRYNLIERGQAESVEHILASATVTAPSSAANSLASYATSIIQPHFTADFAAINANDASTAAGFTPHDGQVVDFAIPAVPTVATISATSLNFGSLDLGASLTKSVTITNTTSFPATITIQSVALSGTNATDFTQTSGCTTLAANASCTVNITFSPTATGTRTGTLTVTNDSSSAPMLTTSLTGIGLDTTATLTPATAAFGSTYAGGATSAPTVFTLTNTSAVSIGITSVATSTNFSDTTTCGATLAAGTACTISVVFAPTAAGALTGTLTVHTTSSANPVLTSTLTGTGLATSLTITPTTANFGSVILGVTSATQTFTIANPSSIAIALSGVAATGDFLLSANSCGASLAANSSCTVAAAFRPTALGARTGTVTVTSSASADPTLSAALTGIGVADIDVSPAALSFGNVPVGATSAAQTVTITNHSSSVIGLTSIAITSDFLETSTCGSALNALSACTLSVTAHPVAAGTRPGTLTITTNDPRTPTLVVSLTVNAGDFSIAIAPTSGSVIAGLGTAPVATVTPIGGYAGTLALSCTSNAVASPCTFSPSTLSMAGAAASSTVTIGTTSKYTVIGYGGTSGGRGPRALLLGLVTLLSAGLLTLRRRALGTPLRLTLLLLGCVALASLSGCSGKLPALNASYTEPGSYTYTITATDGVLTHSTTYTLAVRAQ